MAIITSIGVVALASMAAILINDYTRFGGHLEDGDEDFSVFARPMAAVTVPVKTNDALASDASSKVKKVALV